MHTPSPGCFTIRLPRSQDLPTLCALNHEDVLQLSPLTLAELERLVAMTAYFRVAEADGRVGGFLLAMAPDAPYESLNFRYFCERYERFFYIDRVVISRHLRRLGLASALYADLERQAKSAGALLLACEVNLRPPNEPSLIFHERRGFGEVGTADRERGTKRVSLRIRPLVRS